MKVENITDQATILEWSGERYLPDIQGNIELEHTHRYIFARELTRGKVVLDIACGEGYGSYFLSETAKCVYGVDISEEVIAFAQNKYQQNNLTFKVGLCSHIPLPDRSVDVVVSFETIEHHEQHEDMMKEIVRVLRPEGLLILSSPDKHEYSEVPDYHNPFHVKELYKEELEALLSSHFSQIKILGQRLMFGSSILNTQKEISNYKIYQGTMNALSVHGVIKKPVYFVVLASNSSLPDYFNSFYEGAQGSLKEKNHEVSNLSAVLYEKEEFLLELSHSVKEKNKRILNLLTDLILKEDEISSLRQEVANREEMINHLGRRLRDIYASNSWKITFPFRFFSRIIRKIGRESRLLLKKTSISALVKKKINNNLFSLFRQEQKPILLGSLELFQQLFKQAQNDKSRFVPFKVNPKINTPIKFIAFYLPQFHPIPENDEWWGKGFTEWTNVSKAVPQFIGHYQPHLPGELGFYDLRLKEIQKRQIELAKNYGIHGFCYYHYWFAGKKLLQQPFETVLEDKSLDLPFCLCWANENWTRRWDGMEKELLVKQNHSPEDDIAFIKDIESALSDKRYIRIYGKPLLIVYNTALLPDPGATAKRWREHCIISGVGDLYLGAAQTFGIKNIPDGFDVLIEFPPHHIPVGAPPLNSQLSMVNPNYQGKVVDYRYVIQRARTIVEPNIPLHRTVFPSWDNEARMPGRGYSFINSSPALFKGWLEDSITYARKNNDEPLVFINAWNEWAEGAHLEPDRKYGYAWLQATYDALLETIESCAQSKIILILHDALPYGAQYLGLKLVQTLVTLFGYAVDLILIKGGALTVEFEKWSTVHNIETFSSEDIDHLLCQLAAQGHTSAILNTTVSGLLLNAVKKAGLKSLALIHELPGIIQSYNLYSCVEEIAHYADVIVFPATQIAEAFHQISPIKDHQKRIKPQGLIKSNVLKKNKSQARDQLRLKLGLKNDAQIILGMGHADHRKGVDLFIEIGLQILVTHPNVYFVWVGSWEKSMREWVEGRLSQESARHHFYLNGFDYDTDLYFAGADVFALTSREDPYPSVVLQSLEVGVPVIGFEEAGGFTSLLEQGCGLLVPREELPAYAKAIVGLLEDVEKRSQLGLTGMQLIKEQFSFNHYVFDLLTWIHIPLKRISVIVPNYNYSHFLSERLHSITNQSYPIFEVLILDDASTDNSLEIIEEGLKNTMIDHQILINNKNSGSVFAQWKKGVDKARGDFIWICEADDVADINFLQKVIQAFHDEQVAISYSQSKTIDAEGRVIAEDYCHYTNDINIEKWKMDYIGEGKEELAQALSIKNTIPNVSGVIFRKKNLQEAINRCENSLKKLKIAGDWLIYSEILCSGKIGFVAESLNFHRRHSNSMVSALTHIQHVAEVIFLQNYVAELIVLAPGVVERANHYIGQLCIHFGIAKNDALDFADRLHGIVKCNMDS